MKKLQIIILLSFLSMAVKAQVVADYTYTTSLCGPFNVSFLDNSLGGGFQITSWAWDLGDGQTSTVQSPSNVYTSAGTYNVCLTATNSNGQSDTECKMIELTTPVADAGPDMELNCVNPSVILDGLASSQGASLFYSWTTINGNILSGVNTLNPEVNTPGVYTLVVTDAQTGCTDESSVTVTSNANGPVCIIAPPPPLSCNQAAITLDITGSSVGPNFIYEWSNGANITSIVVNTPGIYSLTITDITNGCTAVSSVTVEENTNVPTFSFPNTSVCDGEMVSLTAGMICSNCTIELYDPTGILLCNSLPCSFSPINGTYTFTVTDNSNGCTNSDNFTMSVSSPITINSLVTNPSCFGEADGVIEITSVTG